LLNHTGAGSERPSTTHRSLSLMILKMMSEYELAKKKLLYLKTPTKSSCEEGRYFIKYFPLQKKLFYLG
jgi:hypothetical protein